MFTLFNEEAEYEKEFKIGKKSYSSSLMDKAMKSSVSRQDQFYE